MDWMWIIVKTGGNPRKMHPETILIEDYNYELPDSKIAEYPLEKRDNSRLLVYANDKITDSYFKNLHEFLPSGSDLILNNTRVIEARIHFQKPTGAIIEIFCLEPFNPSESEESLASTNSVEWLCMIGGASKWKPGQILTKILKVNNEDVELYATYKSKTLDAFVISFSWNKEISFGEILHAAGSIPLPPYIKRKPIDSDSIRYQTIFARNEGSVAAPTASLHFTDSVFHSLDEKSIKRSYITLHVGAGTFKPVKSVSIANHQMHGEHFYILKETLKQLALSQTIIASGTTTLRTLESLYWLGVKLNKGKIGTDLVLEQWECYDNMEESITYKESMDSLFEYCSSNNLSGIHGKTSLIIVPGYKFRSAKALITNFHQPRSTLLLLVAAFVGENWKKIYEHALNNNYRFLSYGDGSLLWRNQ